MRNSQRAVVALLGAIVVLMLMAAIWITIAAPRAARALGRPRLANP